MQNSYNAESRRADGAVAAPKGRRLSGTFVKTVAVRAIAGLAITAAVSALVWWLADWSQLLAALRALAGRPELLAALLISYAGAFAMRAVTWKQLISSRGGIFSLFSGLQAALLANHLLPFKLGEAVRPLLATPQGIPLVDAASTTAVARLMDFASLVLIASVCGSLLTLPGGRSVWLQSLAITPAVVCVVAVALPLLKLRALDRVTPSPIRTHLQSLRQQLETMSRTRLVRTTMWTLPSWILEAGVLLVAAQALGTEISLPAAVAVTAFTILFQVFHVTLTIILWGTIYYHLRIGTSWFNFTRFWRLVLENRDPTSGNFLEQIPKLAILVLSFQMLVDGPTVWSFVAVEGFAVAVAITTLLLPQWFFTWPPAPCLVPTRSRAADGKRISRRFTTVVTDGRRFDPLPEADTPFIHKLRAEGVDYVDMSTMYPARTVTGFSSMFTGAPPRVHGMSSNFVPSLGVKCESISDALRAGGLKLVGIPHLVDAFGEEDVETVTAVTNNDEIDDALKARAKTVVERDDPDLLILQLLSVDQTGHARGSYNSECLSKIEDSDRHIEDFLGWCDSVGYLEGATVLITADHRQGIGIGGHGRMGPTERYVPCVMRGEGVELAGPVEEPRSVMDVTATIAYYLGVEPPAQSVGQVQGVPDADEAFCPVAVIIPAYNEAENLPATLARIPRQQRPDLKVIVMDDGSSDDTVGAAQRNGADVVVSHPRNRGLGAALRTGLATANELDARAAVYVDADGEYPPEQIPDLLALIEADYVLGSRYLGNRPSQRAFRRIGNLAFTAALNLACGRRITDGQTGFRAFSRRALECAEIIHDYNYAQVLTLDLLKKGMRMREVPVSYQRRTKGRSFIDPEYLWRVPTGMLREMPSR